MDLTFQRGEKFLYFSSNEFLVEVKDEALRCNTNVCSELDEGIENIFSEILQRIYKFISGGAVDEK